MTKSGDIPVSGRIMALADVYDALISKRIYKNPLAHDDSIALMASERGAHFDPDVLDTLLVIADDFAAIANRYRDEHPVVA